MAKEKKKSSLLNIGVTVVRYAKYLTNPIVLYILSGFLILLLLAGFIGFFTALPGSVSGWISNVLQVAFGDDISLYEVEDDEVLDLAIQLENMGYDIENYGFVETIERGQAIDGNTYMNNQPQKGEIKKVTSKYLTAYLGEEKKIYKVAPINYSPTSITEDYYLMLAIKSLGKLDYFGEIFERN